jgi:hypothetical protein
VPSLRVHKRSFLLASLQGGKKISIGRIERTGDEAAHVQQVTYPALQAV